ncbi:MAG: hypothetical protein R3F39_09595 [Myxococcota bacterium]
MTVNPGLACGAVVAGQIPLDRLTGAGGCPVACGVNATFLRFTSAYAYPPGGVTMDPAVTCVRGTLSAISTNLTDLTADSVTVLGVDLLIQSNASLTAVSFMALPTIGTAGISNDLLITSNPALEGVDFSSLGTIFGKLEITSNGLLPNLGTLAGLTAVLGAIKIWNNATLDLPFAELAALTVAGSGIEVSGNPAMATLDLSALTLVGFASSGSVTINANALVLLDLSGLMAVQSGISVTSEPNLFALSPAAWVLPAVAKSLVIANNPSLLDLNVLTSILAVGQDVLIDNNDALGSITGLGGTLAAVGAQLTVRGNGALPAVSFPVLPAVGRLELRDNDAMVALGFDVLAAVTGEVRIEGNASLPDVGVGTVGFPMLAMTSGQVYVHDNDAMTALVFPALAAIGWQLWVSYNPALTLVDFPALAATAGELHFNNNTALPAIGGPLVGDPGFPVLGAVAKRIYLDSNTALAFFRLPALAAITSPIGGTAPQAWVKFNTALTRFVLDTWVDPVGFCGPGGPGLNTITAKANMGVCADLFAIPGCGFFVAVTCTP